MTSLLTYRLRVYPRGTLAAAFGTATPLLDVSSDESHVAPWIGAPPNGDGRSVDWLTGSSTVGSYTVQVLDPVTDTDDVTGDALRLVTSVLADASARQQLMGCPALIEYTRGAGSPVTLVAGVCTAARLATAAAYDVVVGDARRGEATRQVFGTVSPSFRGVTCLIGGPVASPLAGGFPLAGGGSLPDYGPQRWRVVSTNTATGGRTYRRVTIQFVRGPVKPSYNVDSGAMGQAGVDELNTGAVPYFERASFPRPDGALGWYPRLVAELRTPGGSASAAPLFLCTPLSVFDIGSGFFASLSGFRLVAGPHAQIHLIWPEGPTPPALPSIGTEFDLLLYPADVSEHNPLHILGHPVDVITGLWADGGDAYDPTAADAVKAALGDYRVALRATAAKKHQDVLDSLCGFFGLAVGFDASARRVLKLLRSTAPVSDTPLPRITLDDLRDAGAPFDVAEGGAVTAAAFKTVRFVTGATGDAGARPLDSLTTQKYERTVTTDDPGAAVGEHTQSYQLDGGLFVVNPTGGLTEWSLDAYADAQGRFIFDRRSRGAITGTIPVGPGVTAQPGDEVVLDLVHLPNAIAGRTPTARRGGERVVLITRRTEVPGGADLAFEDAGTEAQPLIAPTVTLSASSEPRKYVTLTLGNRAALAAAGDTLRVEVLARASGASAPAASEAGQVLFSAPAATVVDVVTAGPYDAGAKVWVRMRTERQAHRSSAYTAWTGRALVALSPPTGLSVAVDSGDPSQLTATLAVGETDQPVEALVALAGETDDATRYRWVVFPPGSTRLPLRRELAADGSLPAVVVRVRHREALPFRGLSTEATASVSGATSAALPAPLDPTAFAGSLDAAGAPVLDGTYGLEVAAALVPSRVEVWEGVETAPASGTYAPATLVADVPSVLGGRTRVSLRASADGRRRRLAARHTRLGAVASGFTAALDVLPWGAVSTGPTAPPTPPTPPDAGAPITVVDAHVALLGYGTSCASPAMLRLTLAISAPLATTRTLTVTDPVTGGAVLTVAGNGVASSWTADFSAHGWGNGRSKYGDAAFAAGYVFTVTATGAGIYSDTAVTSGDALANSCL